jgi:hypothetical protein
MSGGASISGGAEAPEAARAAAWLRAARNAIDAAFGEGAAAARPELVGLMVQAMAIERAAAAGEQAAREALQTATRISRETNETMLKMKPKLF